MREYETTHPWLSFRLDLERLQYLTWTLLGEARSKCEHLAGVPLRPSTAAELHKVYLAKGALATTAIEGNTLSEDEARRIIDGSLKLPRSKAYLAREIENVVAACNGIWKDLREKKRFELTPEAICAFNAQVLDQLEHAEEVRPGRIRMHVVGVASYKAPAPKDVQYLLNRMCEWLNGPQFQVSEELGVVPRILAAIMAHLYLAWIHPFGDGNGRTARLVEVAILASSGIPMPAAHLLSNHYNETRTEYYRQLDFASKSKGNVVPFIHYAVQGFVDGLKTQLAHVRLQQLDVAWENFVHGVFANRRTSTVETRRKTIVLAISRSNTALTPTAVMALPQVVTLIAKREVTERTLYRDIAELVKLNLLVQEPSGVRAKKETIEAFLPATAGN